MKTILESKKIHHKISYFLTPIFTILFFILIFFCTESFISKLEQNKINRIHQSFQDGIKKDLDYLTVQGNEVAKNTELQQYLESKDFASLLSTMLGEKNTREIGLMGVTDADGYIIARTKTISQKGQHTFVTSPQGRAIARGVENPATIEVSSFDPHQVLMTTGRKIYMNDKMIGALFSNYLMDDTYATKFINKYLIKDPDVNVIFYTNYYGVFGSSFSEELKKDINLYIDSNQNIIGSDKTDTLMKINDVDYFIKKIPFEGLERTDTGALIFIPIYNSIEKISISILLGTIILLLYIFIRHLTKRHTTLYHAN